MDVRMFVTEVALLAFNLGLIECHAALRDSPVNAEDASQVPLPAAEAVAPARGETQLNPREVQHIKEHYEGVAELDFTRMPPQEFYFHYFMIHDFDRNGFLDGIELSNGFSDFHADDIQDLYGKRWTGPLDEGVRHQLFHFAFKIDKLLERYDSNNDGYVSYLEYSKNPQTFLRL